MPSLRLLKHPSAVLFACLFASQAGMLVLSPILPDIAAEFGVSTATAGQLRSVSGLTGGVTAVLLALARRRPGARALLSAGAGLVAGGAALSAVAPSFATLAGAQAVIGVGVGVLVAVGIAAAGAWATADRRAHVLAWAIAGMPAAWIAGMPAVGVVAGIDWRAAWLVPALAALAALALVRLRERDPASRRTGAAAAWRSPEVARFTAGELLANAAWASVLTYAGALLLTSYEVSAAVVALGLGAAAAAMLPGTFSARRHAARATPAMLMTLTVLQGGAVLMLGTVRPAAALTLALLSAMAFVNGWRSMVASALGMDSAPADPIAVMSMRAAANQFGYLLGAAAGGLALATGGFGALGATLAAMFAAAALVHAPALLRTRSSTRSTDPKGIPVFAANRYIIRAAADEDAAALAHIAEVDSQRPLQGPVLVGLIDGRPAAAISLEDGRAVADPFRSTGHLVAHLRVRAGAVTVAERMPSVRERMLAALSPAARSAARSAA
jgi:predicted MFS family arabinose efflux permease